MSRLGLLAVAFSDGKVLLYSLPHAQDLHAYRTAQVTGRKSCNIPWESGRQAGPGVCHSKLSTQVTVTLCGCLGISLSPLNLMEKLCV